MLRSYAKYLRQAGFPYSQSHIETVVNDNAGHGACAGRAVRGAVRPRGRAVGHRQEARRPGRRGCRRRRTSTPWSAWTPTGCCGRSPSMIQATLRTNYFVTSAGSARSQNVLSIKLEPRPDRRIAACRDRSYEIFVYSPRVEGVHLRFGNVARGGLRWSDRREDFRTEILGLVKAQAVKNAVIVPVGAKGGFVLKNPPAPTGDAAADRDALAHRGRRLLPAVHLRPARRDRQRRHRHRRRHTARGRGSPRRRRRLPRRRRRQGHRDVLRHRQRRRQVVRLLARRRVRLRRLGGLRPQGDGHHRQGRLGVGQAALPRDGRRHPDRGLHRGRRRRHERRRVRQRHAAVQAHSAGRGVRPPARLPRPEPRRGDARGSSGSGCSRCRGPAGTTTTAR